jgi:transposase
MPPGLMRNGVRTIARPTQVDRKTVRTHLLVQVTDRGVVDRAQPRIGQSHRRASRCRGSGLLPLLP